MSRNTTYYTGKPEKNEKAFHFPEIQTPEWGI
jgi:hypothetical protein